MSLGTDSVTADYIRSHLDDDLEALARQQQPCPLQPSLAPFLAPDGGFVVPESASAGAETPLITLYLQVMSVKDVSLSREQRCRALVRAAGDTSNVSHTATELAAADDAAAVVDATLQAIEDQNDETGQQTQQNAPLRPSGGQWRCLRLELSDGFRRAMAVEDASATSRQRYGGLFAPDGVVLGSKVKLSVRARDVQHGVLRLHAGNATMLGGRVRALERFWETQARQTLAASTGKPSRQPQQQHQQQQLSSSSPPAPLAPPSAIFSSASPHQQSPAAAPNSLAALVAATTGGQQRSTPIQRPPSSLQEQPLRMWPRHVAQHPPSTPFLTVAFISEVVSDMVINEPPPTSHGTSGGAGAAAAAFTYALLAQLSSPDAVERDSLSQQQQQQQQQQVGSVTVTEDDHLTVDLGHTWLRQLVGMPAEDFRALSLSADAADVARLTRTVEAVGQSLEQFGKGRFTLVRRATDGIVEVVGAEQIS